MARGGWWVTDEEGEWELKGEDALRMMTLKGDGRECRDGRRGVERTMAEWREGREGEMEERRCTMVEARRREVEKVDKMGVNRTKQGEKVRARAE